MSLEEAADALKRQRHGKVAPVMICVPPPRLASPEPVALPRLLGRRLSHDVDHSCYVSSRADRAVCLDSEFSLPALVNSFEGKGRSSEKSAHNALQVKTPSSVEFVQQLALIISCNPYPQYQSSSVSFLKAELQKAEKKHQLRLDPPLDIPKLSPQAAPQRSFLKRRKCTVRACRLSADMRSPPDASKDELDKSEINAFVGALEKTRQRIEAGKWKMNENRRQLQSSAMLAARRFRSALHCSPHRPFHLPAPMHMQPVVERAKKIQIRLPSARSAQTVNDDTTNEQLSPCQMQKRVGVIVAPHVPPTELDAEPCTQSRSMFGPLCLDPLRVIQLSSACRGGGTSISSKSETEDDDDSTHGDSACTSRCTSRCMSRMETPSPTPEKPPPRLLLQVRKERKNIDNALEALDKKAELSKCGRRATMACNNDSSDFRRRLSSILEISEQVVDQRVAAMQSRRESRRGSTVVRRSSTLGFERAVRRLSTVRRASTLNGIDCETDESETICEDEPAIFTPAICEDDSDEDPPEQPHGLHRVRKCSSWDERMKRLRKFTTLHSLKFWSSKEDLGMSEMERARYAAVFSRYDSSRAGCLGPTDVHYALEDLGLRLSCRQSKEELFFTLQAYEGSILDFRQFCEVIVNQRKNILESQRFTLKELFQKYDTDESGSLQPEAIMELFKETDLCPVRADERIAFCDAVLECDIDEGGFDWDGFEELAQLLREKLAHCRYERELRIFYQTKLPFPFFINFRHQLTWLHESFHRFDTSSLGYLQLQECVSLIIDLGFERSRQRMNQLFECDRELSELTSVSSNLNFTAVLKVLQRIRDLRIKTGEDIKNLFDRHDMCRTGFLKISEVVRLLTKIKLDVVLERRPDLLQIVEEGDIDGDGCLSSSDFLRVFHHLHELCLRRCGEEERSRAESLGFSNDEFLQLREGFGILENPDTLCLDLDGLVRALRIMGETWASEESLFDVVGHNCRMNLKDFLDLCAAVNNVKEKPDNYRKTLVCESARKICRCNQWESS